jgi:hypothetical protein
MSYLMLRVGASEAVEQTNALEIRLKAVKKPGLRFISNSFSVRRFTVLNE